MKIPDRFNIEDYYTGNDNKPLNDQRSIGTKYGCFLDDPFMFDNRKQIEELWFYFHLNLTNHHRTVWYFTTRGRIDRPAAEAYAADCVSSTRERGIRC